MRQTMQRRVTPDQVRAIRAAFDQRRAVPSDRELAERYKISVRLVRAIGRRERYRRVPD